MKPRVSVRRIILFQIVLCSGLILGGVGLSLGADIGPLPEMKVDKAKAELGKRLFFDSRLSGDAAISCASCHDPKEGWTKHVAVGEAYPGSKHFRNAPTLINAAIKNEKDKDGKAQGIPWLHDGRIGSALDDVLREMITESYIMNMDMQIMQERFKQDPVYVKMFQDAFGAGKEINHGMTRAALVEFLKTVVSKNVPFDQNKLSPEAKKGLDLFKGKAGCGNCHSGPMFSDGKPHNTGVPENPEIFKDHNRHVTYVTYLFSLGGENRFNWRRDVGHYTVTHEMRDLGKFVTPSLRELKYTAPYMHNGMLATLDDVIEFYNTGGGPDRPGLKDGMVKSLGLSPAEKGDLKAFLLSLSGDDPSIEPLKPELSYKPIADWYKVKN